MSNFDDLYAKSPNGGMTVLDLLIGIRLGQWKREVEHLRELLEREGDEAYQEEKKKLPAVSVSGIITGKRKNAVAERRLHPTGLIQCDCDGKANPKYSAREMKKVLIATGYFIAVWTSPSEKGVKGIARISQEPDDHRGCFLALEKLLAEVDLILDPDTKDATRLMLVSDDPELWINPDIPPVLLPLQQEKAPAVYRNKTERSVADDDVEEVQAILDVIPTRPSYEPWTRITWAVFNVLGVDRGLPLLKEWSPEEKLGEYQKLYKPDHDGKKLGLKTLIKYAKAHGYDHNARVPKDVIPVPAGEISHTTANRIIFKSMAATRQYFIRENMVVEVGRDSSGGGVFEVVTPERLIGHVEKLGKRVARREAVKGDADGRPMEVTYKWRTATFPNAAAKVALQSQEGRDLLPPLRQIVGAPIIVQAGDRMCKVLDSGYHREGGGTYVASDFELPKDLKLNHITAAHLLKGLLKDFRFATESDMSRAMASLISPALKTGGWIAGDYPLDLAEAAVSQSGKSYRQRLVSTLYNEEPSVITSHKGGVGSLDESVANALLDGKRFIALDNMRGSIDSQLLESALRGHGVVECRGFRANGRVNVSPFIWQLSTNGAQLTRDLANRACIIRIIKQPPTYEFKKFREGDLLAHVRGMGGLYLTAVFELIRTWAERGKPTTLESRHDFREWTQALDWIVQNLCGLPPLLDGHREQQLRTGDRKLQWLRDILLAAGLKDNSSRGFTASQMLEIAESSGIDFPGGPSKENSVMRVGKILSQIFGQAVDEIIEIDGFRVTRSKLPIHTNHGIKDQPHYTVSRGGG